MIILGIDLETGGSFNDPLEKNFITEIGAVLWDTDSNTPIKTMNTFVKNDKRMSEEAIKYTGIKQDHVDNFGLEASTVNTALLNLMEMCEYIVAHNGNKFDKPILEMSLPLPDIPWIDTRTDIPYPSNCMSRNLTYLQGFHGFNYPGHRAIFDVMAMLRILSMYDLDQVLNIAKSPVFLVKAKVNFDTKEKAKAFNFYWDAPNKRWLKEIKEYYFADEAMKYDFEYEILEEL